jgi:ribosomal protein L11 methyltransferase
MNDYIEVKFGYLSPAQREVIIALLSEAGYDGFEEDNDELKAYIAVKDYNRKELVEIAREHKLIFTLSFIKAKNWNSEWENNFHPVVIDDFCGIRADFHQPLQNVEHEIIITPKMSFGTGHHATTEMMIKMMKETDFKSKTVLDFGTGTGVLAILAEKLGAKKIIAVDNDEWSIENAKENLAINECTSIELINASSPVARLQYDVILANIIKTVILENFSALIKQLADEGKIIFSGLLKTDESEIIEQFRQFGYKIGRQIEKGNWICVSVEYDPHFTGG